jgi:membrane-associated phospholipid phosphatase
MRTIRNALVLGAMAAVAAGVAAPAAAAASRGGPAAQSSVAFTPGSGQSAVDWNRELITILGTPGAQPATVHPTRSFAILQAAEYDAVTSITHAAQPYLFSVPAPGGARPDAAADQAAHDVLTALYPSQKSGLDQMLASELAAIPNGQGKQQGIKVGAAVARRLLALRSSDGSAATPPPFVAGNKPGDYRPTPPAFAPPVFTNWGSVTPFVLSSGRQFRPAPPPPITSAAYASALNQVKSLGQDTSTTRTADETTQAKFWGAAPIWNVWNEVTQKLAVSQHASLQRTVTVFENLDLALADATIADPSYPGAHAAISQTAATVLSAFFGDHQQLIVSSDGDPGVTRSFGSFQAAADEATLSRIFAGQHTMIDLVAGQQLGRQVAEFVLGHLGSAPAGTR